MLGEINTSLANAKAVQDYIDQHKKSIIQNSEFFKKKKVKFKSILQDPVEYKRKIIRIASSEEDSSDSNDPYQNKDDCY